MTPGSYHTRVEKDGFASPLPDLRLLSNSEFRVASTGDPVKVELKLTPFETIRGRVLGPDGKPAAGVEVSLDPNITADEAATDREGRFALPNIRPGVYTLIAKPPKSAQPEESSDGTRTAIVTTYYPGVADASLTQPIMLRGQGAADYEIRMQTAPVHRVRGIVLDDAGKPLPEAELSLFRIPEGMPEPMGMSVRAGGRTLFAVGLRRGSGSTPEATAIAGKDGHFEFPAVRSGNWRIDTDPAGDAASRGTADVYVGRADVDELEVHAATPFKLIGRVEWIGAQVSSSSSFGVMSLISPVRNEFVRGGLVESSGLSFENVLPGRYQAIVKPGLSARIFVNQDGQGENEVTGQTFPVNAGSRLRVVLKTWSGTVRGTVEKGEGATAVLVQQRFEGVAFGQTVVCGAGGSFELSEVSPGDYYIAAFDHLDGLSPSAAMLSLVPSRGTSVKVVEHSAADVTLSVIALPR
jgi:hypothetical protein